MSRTPVDVRDLGPQDGPALARLWHDLPHPAEWDEHTDLAAMVLAALADDPGSRVLVAESGGEVVGTAYLRAARLSPLLSEEMLNVSHLQVEESQTRRGVGRALLEAALTHAEHHGIPHLLVAGAVNDRETNRFLARLGLAQVAVVRGSTVAALRARMPVEPSVAARSTRSKHVGQVVAARRLQRRSRVRNAVS
ncbi:GNAT family N-acetyltransferase [Nocardioides marmoribigeumensis]|uniref:GNAT superfamily N-acetyltransferase n=1 Tax=Nocardioides marmoribigeumensis TaxID=433649 RepID=A0ABU2BSH2_9ACTN|nr:GNAT family N-acetyltransferase [Nocardioides marmoribigeumensis]MDR7361221.1 GNAT superfamily N-acetyltransferase [Nocardioides marmoribigeumensis]